MVRVRVEGGELPGSLAEARKPPGRSRAELETAWSLKTGKVSGDVGVQPAGGENTCNTEESPRVGGGVTSRRGWSTPSLSELLKEP